MRFQSRKCFPPKDVTPCCTSLASFSFTEIGIAPNTLGLRDPTPFLLGISIPYSFLPLFTGYFPESFVLFYILPACKRSVLLVFLPDFFVTLVFPASWAAFSTAVLSSRFLKFSTEGGSQVDGDWRCVSFDEVMGGLIDII